MANFDDVPLCKRPEYLAPNPKGTMKLTLPNVLLKIGERSDFASEKLSDDDGLIKQEYLDSKVTAIIAEALDSLGGTVRTYDECRGWFTTAVQLMNGGGEKVEFCTSVFLSNEAENVFLVEVRRNAGCRFAFNIIRQRLADYLGVAFLEQPSILPSCPPPCPPPPEEI